MDSEPTTEMNVNKNDQNCEKNELADEYAYRAGHRDEISLDC